MAAVKKIQPLIDLLKNMKNEYEINCIRHNAAPIEGEELMLKAAFVNIERLEQAIFIADTPRKPKGGNSENS